MYVFLDKLQMRLRSEGGIKALLGMVRCRHPDVLSQVARGIANFAKCESRASGQGKFFHISERIAEIRMIAEAETILYSL